MKQIAVYAGRFQPFGPHHKRTFDWMTERFGLENCYISTSDNIDDKSPLNFSEKCSIINKFGISSDRIIRSPSPYRPVLENVDMDNTTLFLAIGAKDENNINYFKKDGTLGYYKEYFGQRDLERATKSGYVIVAPHTSINHADNEVCGTYLREVLPKLNESEFTGLMGWYDPEVHTMIKYRFTNGYDTINSSGRKHINHVYDDLNQSELSDLFHKILTGKIDCYEKFDGVHLEVTIRYGQVMAARSKMTVINPFTVSELCKKYEDRELIRSTFVYAMNDMIAAFTNVPHDLRLKIENDNLFINMEIINPENPNVYLYDEPYIVLHGLIKYDQSGNEVGRIRNHKLIDYLIGKYRIYTIIPPNKIKVPEMGMYAGSIRQLLSTIKDPSKLENVVTKIGYNILKHCTGYMAIGTNVMDRYYDIHTRVLEDEEDDKIRERFFANLTKIYPSINKPSPFEGLVFEYNNKTYKLTGSFRYINQILGLYRYK